jgi:hypothetical protein
MSDEPVLCMYKSDKSGEIGTPGEVLKDDGSLHCEAEADHVLRPKGSWHIREFGRRVPFCNLHGQFLVNDAQADWEMISLNDLSQLRRGENNE